MRHYETIYIINPNLSDEEYREVVEKFNALIDKQKGVVIKTQDWGKQRMAYEIKKSIYGYYVLVDFCSDQGVVAELERGLKLDDRILKYQTVKLADRADPQELLQKEEETKKIIPTGENQAAEADSTARDEEIAQESEVEDGEGE
jgi:small subunit ribosomal protein S6